MKKILVIWDHHPSADPLLQKASDLAAAFDADVELCAFISQQVQAEKSPAQLAQLQSQIRAAEQHYFSAFTSVNTHILLADDVATRASQLAEKLRADLIIKTGHRSETLFYTPTDWQLMREAPCPVLFISPVRWRSKPVVLAAVDAGSSSQSQQAMDREVLRAAQAACSATGSELHAFYNLNIAKPLTELDIVEPGEVLRAQGEGAKVQLAGCLTQAGIEAKTSHLTAGDISKNLPSVANKIRADLVVLGCAGRAGLKGWLLGNTAEKVIHQLRTDLLVVRPAS